MPEWSTYQLSDFLMYSMRSYLRMLQNHHAQWWPVPWLGIAIALGVGLALWRGRAPRASALALAAVWAFVGWAFLLNRFSTIHWGMRYAAWAFFAQSVLLLWLARRSAPLHLPLRQRAAAVVFVLTALLLPLAGLTTGRTWPQLEAFALTADPTALATLAWLAIVPGRHRIALLIVPILWTLYSAVTWGTLGTMDSAVLLVGLAITLALAALKR